MDSVTFLGSGGGRFVFLAQRRYSGGIWLEMGGARFIVDPGPGALVRALQFQKDPGLLDCVMASHMHLDHYNDAEVMVEAMTHGLNRRHGILVLQEGVAKYISEYHRGAVKTIVPKAGDSFDVGKVGVEAIPTTKHVGGLGFRFDSGSGTVTYSGDTSLDGSVIKHYKDSRLLILNTIFPHERGSDTHLNTDDALEIAKKVKPDHLVITHFGVRLLALGPEKEARRIEEETGVPTTAAEDGMTISVSSLRTAVSSPRSTVYGLQSSVYGLEDRKPKTENRELITENRKPRTDNRKSKTEN
ncbi:MAG: MBL fold metallo-hydrolase [Candidatus Altiarchaeota archaeon]